MTTCPTCARPLPAPKPDARHTQWRVRVRLYRAGQDTPEADTDDDRPADAPGAKVFAGLFAVSEHLRELAVSWHAPETVHLLDVETLGRKLKSLRTALGRGGTGAAVWRVPYMVEPPHPVGTGSVWVDWLARVDVVREVTP